MSNNFDVYNQKRTAIIEIENTNIEKLSIEDIGEISKRELLLLCSALYWAEGFQNRNNSYGNKRIQFVNSDPAMIVLFLRFLREILTIKEEKIKISIRVHPNMEKQKAIAFWSEITKIPSREFKITNQVSIASKGVRPQNTLPYGTIDMRVYSRKDFYRINGWIKGLKDQVSESL